RPGRTQRKPHLGNRTMTGDRSSGPAQLETVHEAPDLDDPHGADAQVRARTSPWRTMKTASSVAPQVRQPSAMSASSASVAMPCSTAWRARSDATVRVAHRSDHQARSSGVANVHVEVE